MITRVTHVVTTTLSTGMLLTVFGTQIVWFQIAQVNL
jgi:hypothetical protein